MKLTNINSQVLFNTFKFRMHKSILNPVNNNFVKLSNISYNYNLINLSFGNNCNNNKRKISITLIIILITISI